MEKVDSHGDDQLRPSTDNRKASEDVPESDASAPSEPAVLVADGFGPRRLELLPAGDGRRTMSRGRRSTSLESRVPSDANLGERCLRSGTA